MDQILFLDIETNQEGRIVDYGALFNGNELHEKHSSRLETWIAEADVICGHNVVRHDIPRLSKQLGENLFSGKELIDTLLWSPLLFTKNPYHHLVKGYKIVNDTDANNPLSDCKLTKELLLDELNAFNELDDSFKNAISCLLSASSEHNYFLQLTGFKPNFASLEADILELLKDKSCQNQRIREFIDDQPVAFAYALSLMRLDSTESILPSWVRHTYPESEKIIEDLRFTSCGKSDCGYCSNKLDPKKALLNYFGYSDFRKFDLNRELSLQEETVRAGLQKHSFVAVFPTGGGKSLTFQLPALMRGECTRHLTVIISPLVSLMKDQVDNLEERFNVTKAVAINGLLSPLERQEAIERIEKGEAHLLYLSPESLRSPTIFRLISSRSIARFVIDEAHCFSSWGQDFRVDYLYIAEFIKMLKESKGIAHIPISCFTATAKPQVIDDIKSYFLERLDLDLKEFITNKGRDNLSYKVVEVEEGNKKMAHLLPILEDCEKPAIIYASRTKTVEEVSGLISEAGFSSTFFHGQLDKDVKKENMSSFMSGNKDIIVATSAFGMGVDKDDVKTVIHYNISDSLENYIQEAGRAGRNESIQAKCYILFNEADLNKHFSLLQQTKINKKEVGDIWRALKAQSKRRKKLSQSALEIAKEAGWDTEIRELETRVTTAISALEDQGFLKRNQNSPRIFADSLMVPNFGKGQQIIGAAKDLSEQEVQDCERVFGRIIKDDEARVDYIAERTQLSTRRVQDAIQRLRDLNILGDAKDLTAFINLTKSKNGSREILGAYMKLETILLDQLNEGKTRISLRQLNQNIMDVGENKTSKEKILRLLNYWEIRNLASKKRVDREKELYEIIIKHKGQIKEDIHWRHDLSGSIFDLLAQIQKSQNAGRQQKEDLPVSFSILELKKSNSFMGQQVEENSKKYERALLFMNRIKAIKLEGGFMVSYNKLNIDNIDTSRSKFTNEDYYKMASHYEHKTEQIHIVGEYAKKSIENYDSALSFVNDYFTLDYEEFLARYFPNRKGEIRRPVTASRFKEIIKELDIDQTSVLRDNKSVNILVLAGPGSGKTKVLVHKIASLLLLEDIKPEQFLMLTFSKAASMEFKYRTRQLVPEFAGLIKITTFHGYCFELLGQLGDLEKSQNVIKDCIEAIRNDDIDITSLVNKSVLLLDEVQDVNELEWELIKTIIEVAGNIRVIAVGDDDQNIYSFRGSSNEYMKIFRDQFDANNYSLLKNYRSRAGIIEFNNGILKTITSRMKQDTLVPARKTLKARINLVKYNGKYLVKPMVQSLAEAKADGTRAVLVRTNHEALLASSLLEELGLKTRLLAGFEGFSMSNLSEVRYFTSLLKERVNDSGLIFEKDWHSSIDNFKEKFRTNMHVRTCLEIFQKFEYANPDKKLLLEWYDYIREISMEDAIHGDKDSVIVATMHKAKGKEFDHVWVLAEDYDTRTDESKRLLYVACTRAKASLHIHTNISFFDSLVGDGLQKLEYQLETQPPSYYEMILGHKEVNLSSQKYPRALNIIKHLKTGDSLQRDVMMFGSNEAPGLARTGGGNMLLFSRDFVKRKFIPFRANGYELVAAKVEYLVYWYSRDEDKEYLVVLPRIRFERENSQ